VLWQIRPRHRPTNFWSSQRMSNEHAAADRWEWFWILMICFCLKDLITFSLNFVNLLVYFLNTAYICFNR
jgi:hypothetical protein